MVFLCFFGGGKKDQDQKQLGYSWSWIRTNPSFDYISYFGYKSWSIWIWILDQIKLYLEVFFGEGDKLLESDLFWTSKWSSVDHQIFMQVAAFATGNMEWLRHGTEDLGGTAAFADWGGFPKGVVIGMTTCESASSQVVMGMTGSWITPTATEQCAEISQLWLSENNSKRDFAATHLTNQGSIFCSS